jgi:hypothetical protein
MRVLAGLAFRSLSTLDALANRLYGSRFNPLYQSGTIVVFLYVVLVVTGVWLTLFYRVGSPWESVSRVTANLWWGNWVRGLHRYAPGGCSPNAGAGARARSPGRAGCCSSAC